MPLTEYLITHGKLCVVVGSPSLSRSKPSLLTLYLCHRHPVGGKRRNTGTLEHNAELMEAALLQSAPVGLHTGEAPVWFLAALLTHVVCEFEASPDPTPVLRHTTGTYRMPMIWRTAACRQKSIIRCRTTCRTMRPRTATT